MAITPKRSLIAFEPLPVELPKKDYEVMHSNPSYWTMDGVRNRFYYVYAPSFPHIEAAYEKEGKTIYRPSKEEVSTPDIETPVQDLSDNLNTSVPMESIEDDDVQQEEEDFEVEDAKVDWKSLSWLPLRTFAKQYTDEKIKNKEHAWEILEALEAEGRL